MNQAQILVIDDDEVIREGLRRVLESRGYAVAVSPSGLLGLERMNQHDFSLVITDLKMPGMGGLEVLRQIRILHPGVPIIMMTGYSTVETAVEAMKNGALDYIAKPFTPEIISEKVRSALDQKPVLVDDMHRQCELQENQGFEDFIGGSREMQRVYRRIMQVAPTDSTVLVTGESGTGKELVARAIHRKSPRRNAPFVAVDCTSLAENLLESELFGHIKGSFTGASQTKTGLFKVADSGTLFLDEIANISLTTQAKLLRVLQERAVLPIGGTQPVSMDIRLVAATNANLPEMVAAGRFREDLFFRLNIIPIELPPLRERKGDLRQLVGHFLNRFAEELGKDMRGLAPDAMALLENYHFPGNVRELENLIERAVVLTEGDLVQRVDLELQVSGEKGGAGPAEAPQTVEELKERKRLLREQAVETIERAFVLDAMRRNKWNVTRAAEEVGMLRPNFQALLKKQGLSARNRPTGLDA
jgi:DNA-binding NtrC family response regulator